MNLNAPALKTTTPPYLLIMSHAALVAALLLWFNPLTHSLCQKLDIWIFQILNGSLIYEFWQNFWGILNHRRETSINLALAALFNIWAIIDTKDPKLRKVRIKQITYFWIFFQIGFTLQDALFNKLLHIERASPSLCIQPVIKLSEILQNTNIKDTSTHSFPGGHAFSLIYWASFTLLSSSKRIGILSLVFAITLCLPRLMSGAHWASDVVFSALLALLWLSWTLYFPIYGLIIKTPNLNSP